MSHPSDKPADPVEHDDYESDEYDEEEHNSGAEDGDEYQDDEGGDDAEDDDDEPPQKGNSLTEQLLLDPQDNTDGDADDDDDAFVPDGGVEPAEQEVDGDKHELSPGGAHEVASLVNPQVPGVSAIGIKRKSSGDEEDAEEDVTEVSEAKRAKADGDD